MATHPTPPTSKCNVMEDAREDRGGATAHSEAVLPKRRHATQVQAHSTKRGPRKIWCRILWWWDGQGPKGKGRMAVASYSTTHSNNDNQHCATDPSKARAPAPGPHSSREANMYRQLLSRLPSKAKAGTPHLHISSKMHRNQNIHVHRIHTQLPSCRIMVVIRHKSRLYKPKKGSLSVGHGTVPAAQPSISRCTVLGPTQSHTPPALRSAHETTSTICMLSYDVVHSYTFHESP